jgi:hypothetical protein
VFYCQGLDARSEGQDAAGFYRELMVSETRPRPAQSSMETRPELDSPESGILGLPHVLED